MRLLSCNASGGDSVTDCGLLTLTQTSASLFFLLCNARPIADFFFAGFWGQTFFNLGFEIRSPPTPPCRSGRILRKTLRFSDTGSALAMSMERISSVGKDRTLATSAEGISGAAVAGVGGGLALRCGLRLIVTVFGHGGGLLISIFNAPVLASPLLCAPIFCFAL